MPRSACWRPARPARCPRSSTTASADMRTAMSRRRWAGLLAALVLPAAPAAALEAPAGKVVLTVSGSIKSPNRDGLAAFDMAMLAALPQHSFTTRTPWYPGPRKFSGPLLRDVLAAAGAKGRTIEALAINDYKVQIPLGESQQHDMVRPRLMDDRPMALRDKGPLFIIYPFDDKPQLRSSIYYSRSAWQLKALVIR